MKQFLFFALIASSTMSLAQNCHEIVTKGVANKTLAIDSKDQEKVSEAVKICEYAVAQNETNTKQAREFAKEIYFQGFSCLAEQKAVENSSTSAEYFKNIQAADDCSFKVYNLFLSVK
jgi:hypothetical protein